MVFVLNGSAGFKSLLGCTGAFRRLQTVKGASECPILVQKTLELRLCSPQDCRTIFVRNPDLTIDVVSGERALHKISLRSTPSCARMDCSLLRKASVSVELCDLR